MSQPDFRSLQSELQELGLSQRHARRTCEELEGHYLDLVDGFLEKGTHREQAEHLAARELGSLSAICEQVRLRPELRSWEYQYPYLALLVYPVACAGMLPVAIARTDTAGRLAR